MDPVHIRINAWADALTVLDRADRPEKAGGALSPCKFAFALGTNANHWGPASPWERYSPFD